MGEQEELDTSVVAVVGLIGAVVVFAIIVLLTVVFHHVEARQQYEKDIRQSYAQVSKLTADQQGRLASYGWVNQQKGVAHIPIDRAKELVVAELSRDPRARVAGPERQDPQPPQQTKENEDAK